MAVLLLCALFLSCHTTAPDSRPAKVADDASACIVAAQYECGASFFMYPADYPRGEIRRDRAGAQRFLRILSEELGPFEHAETTAGPGPSYVSLDIFSGQVDTWNGKKYRTANVQKHFASNVVGDVIFEFFLVEVSEQWGVAKLRVHFPGTPRNTEIAHRALKRALDESLAERAPN